MSEFNDAVNGNVNDDDDDQQLVAIVDNDSNGVELISINKYDFIISLNYYFMFFNSKSDINYESV
jgi:hypothetical protein